MPRWSGMLVAGALALGCIDHAVASPWPELGPPDRRVRLADPRPTAPASSPESSASCLRCGVLYATMFVASDLMLVEIDLPTRSSRLLGVLPSNAAPVPDPICGVEEDAP